MQIITSDTGLYIIWEIIRWTSEITWAPYKSSLLSFNLIKRLRYFVLILFSFLVIFLIFPICPWFSLLTNSSILSNSLASVLGGYKFLLPLPLLRCHHQTWMLPIQIFNYCIGKIVYESRIEWNQNQELSRDNVSFSLFLFSTYLQPPHVIVKSEFLLPYPTTTNGCHGDNNGNTMHHHPHIDMNIESEAKLQTLHITDL